MKCTCPNRCLELRREHRQPGSTCAHTHHDHSRCGLMRADAGWCGVVRDGEPGEGDPEQRLPTQPET